MLSSDRQRTQSCWELWPEHLACPAGCMFFFKSSSVAGPFPKQGDMSGAWWGLFGLWSRVWSQLWRVWRWTVGCGCIWNSGRGVCFEALILWVCVWAPFHPSASLASTSWVALNSTLEFQLFQRFSEDGTCTEWSSKKKWVWLLEISGENGLVRGTGIYLNNVPHWQAF